MDDTNRLPPADEPFFRALLTPHRSLGRTGFADPHGHAALRLAGDRRALPVAGAWPVFGFFGLDVLLVYVAFRANYRAARAREEVSVSRTALDITQDRAFGQDRCAPLQPVLGALLGRPP